MGSIPICGMDPYADCGQWRKASFVGLVFVFWFGRRGSFGMLRLLLLIELLLLLIMLLRLLLELLLVLLV